MSNIETIQAETYSDQEDAYSKKESYYLHAFNKIENGGFHWNWSAFFFPGLWMLYRKMYLESILVTVLSSILHVFELGTGLICSLQLILHVLMGCFANTLYHRVVKDRIQDGYHMMEQFKPTSVSILLFGWLFIGIIFYWAADSVMNNRFLATSPVLDTSFSERNIKLYLSERRENHCLGKIAIGVSCALTFLVPVVICAIMLL